jgi:TonB family protein
MRAIILALGAVIGLSAHISLADTAASSGSPLRVPHVVARPSWLVKPTQAELQWAYPNDALRKNINGFARLGCVVTASGEAVNCQVLSEEPDGAGFGQAALKLTPRFRFQPQTVDGVAVGGANIVIPVRFEIPPSPRPGWLHRLVHPVQPADAPAP